MSRRIAHRCPCGASYTAQEWIELEFVGVQCFPDDAPYELRNCKCGSTRCVELLAATVIASRRQTVGTLAVAQ